MSKLVFDVGFNVGQDTGFYLSQGHRVVAVEADPTLAAAGRRRFGPQIESGQLTIVNVGIAQREGQADFWICEDKPEFNSFHRKIAARDSYRHHRITVQTTRFATLLQRYGTPYYLKIDIEGHDMLCLEDLDPAALPEYVSVESECPVDEESDGVLDGLAMLRRLRDLGYERFKLIDQRSFNAMSVPPSAHQRLEGWAEKYLLAAPLRSVPGTWRLAQLLLTKPRLQRRFDWNFPVGCSGVWGEDTPGKWLAYGDAQRAYAYYRDLYFANRGAAYHSFWCDWHATIRGA